MINEWVNMQLDVCKRFQAAPVPTLSHLKVGITLNVKEGKIPVNGLRCPLKGDTAGWYIWAGEEWSDDPDFLYRSMQSI